MADIFEIPIAPNGNAFEIEIDIETFTFRLQFDWHKFTNRWHLNIFDQNVPVKLGLKIVCNVILLQDIPKDKKPKGYLMFQDTQQTQEIPSFEELGSRFKLYYFEPA